MYRYKPQSQFILTSERAGEDHNCRRDQIIVVVANTGLVTHLITKLGQQCLMPDSRAKAL